MRKEAHTHRNLAFKGKVTEINDTAYGCMKKITLEANEKQHYFYGFLSENLGLKVGSERSFIVTPFYYPGSLYGVDEDFSGEHIHSNLEITGLSNEGYGMAEISFPSYEFKAFSFEVNIERFGHTGCCPNPRFCKPYNTIAIESFNFGNSTKGSYLPILVIPDYNNPIRSSYFAFVYLETENKEVVDNYLRTFDNESMIDLGVSVDDFPELDKNLGVFIHKKFSFVEMILEEK